jgi:hypothetical protein
MSGTFSGEQLMRQPLKHLPTDSLVRILHALKIPAAQGPSGVSPAAHLKRA